MWRDDERGGKVRYEEPTVVTCYADPTTMTDAARSRLRAFLHRLGREANQGEVGIVVGDMDCDVTRPRDGDLRRSMVVDAGALAPRKSMIFIIFINVSRTL